MIFSRNLIVIIILNNFLHTKSLYQKPELCSRNFNSLAPPPPTLIAPLNLSHVSSDPITEWVLPVTCTGRYPIELIFDDEHSPGETSQINSSLPLNSYDATKQEFQIKMDFIIPIFMKKLTFYCQKFGNNCLQQCLKSLPSRDKNLLEFQLLDNKLNGGSWQSDLFSLPSNPRSQCNTTFYYYRVGSVVNRQDEFSHLTDEGEVMTYGLVCNRSDGQIGQINQHFCNSSTSSCASLMRHHRQSQDCVKQIETVLDCHMNCSDSIVIEKFQPFVVTCDVKGQSQVENFGNILFFGVPQISRPEIYSSMKVIDPTKMISMLPFPAFQKLDSTLVVTCRSSIFYNLNSIQFALQFQNQSNLTFLTATHSPSLDHNLHSHVQSQSILLNDSTLEKIYCFSQSQFDSFSNASVRIYFEVPAPEPEPFYTRMEFQVIGGLSVVTLMTLILVIIMAIKKIKRKRRRNVLHHVTSANDAIQEIRGASRKGGRESVGMHPSMDCFNTNLEVSRDRLVFNQGDVLASNAHFLSLRGRLRLLDHKTLVKVVVKTVRPEADFCHFTNFLSEIKILTFLNTHENITQLLACCTLNFRDREVFAAVEWCGKYSLRKIIEKSKNNFRNSEMEWKPIYSNTPETSTWRKRDEMLTPQKLLNWSRDIARGMAYLSEKEVIHRKLELRNILMTEKNMVKISNFSKARVLLESSRYTEKHEPLDNWRYAAIESLKYMQFSVKSDMWAFGVVLFELFSLAETPYARRSCSANFADQLIGGLRLSKPKHASEQMYKMMRDCWHEQPGRRPSFSKMEEDIQEILSNCSTTVTPM